MEEKKHDKGKRLDIQSKNLKIESQTERDCAGLVGSDILYIVTRDYKC